MARPQAALARLAAHCPGHAATVTAPPRPGRRTLLQPPRLLLSTAARLAKEQQPQVPLLVTARKVRPQLACDGCPQFYKPVSQRQRCPHSCIVTLLHVALELAPWIAGGNGGGGAHPGGAWSYGGGAVPVPAACLDLCRRRSRGERAAAAVRLRAALPLVPLDPNSHALLR